MINTLGADGEQCSRLITDVSSLGNHSGKVWRASFSDKCIVVPKEMSHGRNISERFTRAETIVRWISWIWLRMSG